MDLVLKYIYFVTLFYAIASCAQSSVSAMSEKSVNVKVEVKTSTKTNTSTNTVVNTISKTASSVTLTASGYPTGKSETFLLDIKISGTATHYKSKIVTGTGVCTGSGYGSEYPVSQSITTKIADETLYPPGTIKVCVIGKGSSGVYMEASSALEISWTKTVNPIASLLPTLWLRADQGLTVSSSKVSAWKDISGYNNHAYQNTSGAQPSYIADAGALLNNKPAVRFTSSATTFLDSTGDLVLNSSNGATFFAVFNSASASNQVFFTNAGYSVGGQTAAGDVLGYFSSSAYMPYNVGAFNILSTVYDGMLTGDSDQFNMFVNGNKGTLNWNGVVPSTLSTSVGYQMGRFYNDNYWYDGDIAEIIVYNRALSVSERQKVETALSIRYGIKTVPTTAQKLWLKSDKDLYVTSDCTTTPVASTNDTIGCWKDQSGQNNHATQTVGAAKPVYKATGMDPRASVNFNGTSQFLETSNITLPNGASTFVVQKTSSTDNTPGLANPALTFLGDQTAGTYLGFGITDGKLNYFHYDTLKMVWRNFFGSKILNDNNTHIIHNNHSIGGIISGSVNGMDDLSKILTYDATNSKINRIGAGYLNADVFSGDLSEVLVYNDILLPSDKQRIEIYLGQKYEKTISTHPVLDAPGLAAWFKADSGVTISGDTAAQFTMANSESLSIADNAALSTGDIDFSIAGWVYLDTKATYQGYFSKWQVGMREYNILYNPGSDRFIFYVSNDGTATNYVMSNTGGFTLGKWYFIVAVHDSVNNTIGISINDSAMTTVAHSAGVYDGTATVYLGRYETGNFLNGRMAKVGFWKRALSTSERTELYNEGRGLVYSGLSTGLKTSLTAYWNLTEASGGRNDSIGANLLTDNNTVTQAAAPLSSIDTWNDQSGNGNHATQSTLVNKPTWVSDGGTAFNNKPLLRFGGAQYLSALDVDTLDPTTLTYFVVGKTNLVGAWETFFVKGPTSWLSGGYAISRSGATSNILTWIDNWSSNSITYSYTISAPTIFSGYYDYDLFKLETFTNGVSRGSDTYAGAITNTVQALFLGSYSTAAGYLNGEMAEVILYGKNIGTKNRQAIECYLSSKYNIALTGVTCP